MATKAQKRAAGEAKAKREAEERRRSGLEAQRIGRMHEAVNYKAEKPEVQRMNARHAEILRRAYKPVQPEVTVGDFRAMMDDFWKAFQAW